MLLARDRHGTVPWQVFCPLSRSGALEPFLHPCFRPLPQPAIKAMARGVRAAPALEKQAPVGDAFHEHPGPTVSGKRYPTTVNALGMLRASLAMAKEKERN